MVAMPTDNGDISCYYEGGAMCDNPAEDCASGCCANYMLESRDCATQRNAERHSVRNDVPDVTGDTGEQGMFIAQEARALRASCVPGGHDGLN